MSQRLLQEVDSLLVHVIAPWILSNLPLKLLNPFIQRDFFFFKPVLTVAESSRGFSDNLCKLALSL